MADFEQQPCFQSWTPITRLTVGPPGPSEVESARRGLRKLEDAGLVEVKVLRPLSWSSASEEKREGFWGKRPARHRGNQTLHARLAIPQDQRDAYAALEKSWRRSEIEPAPGEIVWVERKQAFRITR